MTPFLHTLNIGTLATWLSVVAFGSVGLLVPGWKPVAAARETVISLLEDDFTLSAEEIPGAPPATSDAAPPEIPDLSEPAPLPEIPDLPAPAAEPRAPQKSTTRSNSTPRTSGQAARGKPGMSDAARVAAGHMPSPSYPADAKRRNQTGTAVIEFTVDASGRVISAYAKSSSGWPLLDAEAVSTVRRWTFSAGGVMKLQRPIVFQLR